MYGVCNLQFKTVLLINNVILSIGCVKTVWYSNLLLRILTNKRSLLKQKRYTIVLYEHKLNFSKSKYIKKDSNYKGRVIKFVGKKL